MFSKVKSWINTWINPNPLLTPEVIDKLNILLHQAILQKNADLVESLITKGASVDSLSEKGFSPLHLAISSDQINIVSILLAHGASLNIASESGFYPLHFAAMKGHTSMVEFLIQHNADVNIWNAAGWTPLYVAAANHHQKTVEFLLKNGADPYLCMQSNLVDIARLRDGSHSTLSKFLKTQMGLNPFALQSLYEHFLKFVKEQKALAELHNKKMIVLLGEFHGGFKHYQVEKRLLRAAKEAGICCVYQELSEVALEGVYKIAAEQYGMEVEAIDTHPNRAEFDVCLTSDLPENQVPLNGKIYLEKIGENLHYVVLNPEGIEVKGSIQFEKGVLPATLTKDCLEFLKDFILPEIKAHGHTHPEPTIAERNAFITREISERNQHAVFITGAAHIEGLLKNEQEKIDSEHFHILPISLARLVDLKDSSNVSPFYNDPEQVIQLDSHSEKELRFSPCAHVMSRWNQQDDELIDPPVAPVGKKRKIPFDSNAPAWKKSCYD